MESEREALTNTHAARTVRSFVFADLIAHHNDAAARLLQMPMAERRDLLVSLGLHVSVWRRDHVDKQSGQPVWCSIAADVDRLVAHFTALPGQDRRRRENKGAGDGSAAAGRCRRADRRNPRRSPAAAAPSRARRPPGIVEPLCSCLGL